jgi:glycosyl transferase family 25
MLHIDKVFVLHVKQGYEDRERFIVEQFKTFGIDFEFVLDYDIPDLTDEIITTRFDPAMHNQPVAMSVNMKHATAWQKLVDGGHANALIFEDDVVLDKRFEEIFNRCMAEVKGIDEDVAIYYSNACNMYVPFFKIKKGRHLYKARASRAADSYSISRTVAQKRLDFLAAQPFTRIIDHQFNLMDPQIGVTPCWCHPTIVEQGSMNGLFESAIDQKRKGSLMRKLDWSLQKIYKKSFRRLFR